MNTTMQISHSIRFWAMTALATVVITLWPGGALLARAAESVSDKIGAAASDAEKQIQDASQAAETRMQQVWQRVDEKRLKNRTPDEIVAWVIMGLLVGGLFQQFSKFGKFATLLLGLAGAFVGGILANVTQVDLQLGPVLIRYEELLASLIGGILLVLAARFLASRKPKKVG